MVGAGRQKSIAFFIALGAGVIAFSLLLYVGWVLLDWHTGILLFFGILLLATIIAGVVLNTIFLVREIRRNEQHDAFINAVTHELKTPLASIRLYLETLLSRNVDEQTRTGFYRTMLDDSDRLLSTVEQVLRTGRLAAQKRVLNTSKINLNELVEECMQKARLLHHLEEGALRFESSPPVVIAGDSEELRAAIANLIENAVKYSGGKVDVCTRILSVPGGYVSVSVHDAGIGIPKVELKRIFKRFYRVPGIATARLKGTGLGLYIVRSVAKRHGGRVWAESEGHGRGSTFFLQLPVAE